MKNNILQILLRILLTSIFMIFGGLFIFHHNIATERVYTYLPFSWMFASVFARILIGLFLFYGGFITFKKITRRTKIACTAIFVFILFDFLIMPLMVPGLTPLESLSNWTVIILSLGAIIISLLLQPNDRLFRIRLPEILLSIGALLWVLLVNPVAGWKFYQSTSDYDLTSFPLEDFNKVDSLQAEQKEDVLVAFFSTTCPHCMQKARRLSIMLGNNHPNVFCYFPDSNNDSTMNAFFTTNGNINLNYQFLPKNVYHEAVKGPLPTIFRFVDGQPVEHYSGYSLTLPTLDYFGQLYQ